VRGYLKRTVEFRHRYLTLQIRDYLGSCMESPKSITKQAGGHGILKSLILSLYGYRSHSLHLHKIQASKYASNAGNAKMPKRQNAQMSECPNVRIPNAQYQRLMEKSNGRCTTEHCTVCHEPHVLGNVIFGQLLGTSPCHGPSAVVQEDTVPSIGVRIRHRPKHALVRVHSSEQQSLLIAGSQIFVQGFCCRPKSAHTGLVEEEVAWLGHGLERFVKFRIPAPLEKASPLVSW
jgi:hypothetical protein